MKIIRVLTLENDLKDRINRSTLTIHDGSTIDPTWTILGNQITIMKTLELLLNTLPMPYDPGPNG